MDKSVLTFREYNIAGNVLRAYYDADDKLVFVLDSTLDDRKPNALLVINPVGDRKWDDILANDYNVDLETVRPKKNNKYQKLDIEYSGLAEYDNLINAYENGDDLTAALTALTAFREDSVRRAATERLAVADANAETARETIVRTRESIAELQTKLRQLRAKLSQQKKQVGREPTKKSASKILRTDAQIDATNEKLRRAKKRLDNAQRRLIVADEDAQIAREILARAPVAVVRDVDVPQAHDAIPSVTTTYNVSYDTDVDFDTDDKESVAVDSAPVESTAVGAPAHTSVAAVASDDDAVARMPVDEEERVEFTENINEEPKAEIMADETNNDAVKPLFDKDPEILDEEIAFKPIEFGVSSPVSDEASPVTDNPEVYENIIDDKPLSFTPPSDKRADNAPINVRPVTGEEAPRVSDEKATTPVLDTITSVNMPTAADNSAQQLDSELVPNISPVVPDAESEPLPAAQSPEPQAPATASPAVDAGARPVPPASTVSAAASAPRPVSPITGNVAPSNPAPRKPTLVYYIMLVLLIGLSIFTLWLYQKNTSENAPDLTATVPTTTETAQADDLTDADSPFIPELETPAAVETVETQITVPVPVEEPEPEPVAEEPEPVEIPEPEPVTEPEPEPVDTPETLAEQVPAADVVVESVAVTTPVSSTEPKPEIPTEEEILASKPAYNVSQNENMFVADENYDTETLRQNNMQAVDTVGPSIVSAPVENQSGLNSSQASVASDDGYVPQSVTSVVWSDTVEDLPTCPDGTAPDVNGCCTGEVYTDMGDMGFNCCPEAGGDCFPPLL